MLESLSSTLIFNSANREEKLALASRLRHWVVEDGTYLIREGDGDRNRSAIFVIGEHFFSRQVTVTCVFFSCFGRFRPLHEHFNSAHGAWLM